MIHDAIRAKFGRYAAIAPWLPQPLLDWEGKWLVRMVSPPFSDLLAQGIKPVENVPMGDWISWGCQGFMVFIAYQGAAVLDNFKDFMPKPITNIHG